jgi:hypothetical protein
MTEQRLSGRSRRAGSCLEPRPHAMWGRTGRKRGPLLSARLSAGSIQGRPRIGSLELALTGPPDMLVGLKADMLTRAVTCIC